MSNDVEKFDPSRLMEGVRDRIKATFISLIPDDQWEKMVQAAIDDFFTPKYHYNERREQSDFKLVCSQELEKLTRTKVVEALNTYSSGNWDAETQAIKVEGVLKDLLTKHSTDIFAKP